MADECKKAAKVLASFVKTQDLGKGPDTVIPSTILKNAKGLAIMTVVKAGFIWSGICFAL